MNLFKNFIKKCAILGCLFMFAGLQALHKPTAQPITPKLYGKMKTQAHEVFEDIRSIPAAQLEAKTQTLKAQRSKQCYDLMMIMDPDEQESNTSQDQTMNYKFFLSLFQKNFPIMVSRNIASNICFRIMNSPELSDQEKSILSKYSAQLAGSIKLNDENWLCYDHSAAKVMLFIPKNYITQFSTSENSDTQVKDCGFETKDLVQINNLSPENVITHISKEKKQEKTITSAIESMLRIPHKSNAPTWNIFLTGHGSTGGSIAGLKAEDFFEILKFFQKIKCSYLHYQSCYTGGFNQKIVKDELSRLSVNFIVSAEGINEESTGISQKIISFPSDRNTKYFAYCGQEMYSNFFSMTESFFGNPVKFAKEKEGSESWQKDPIALIVNTIIDKKYLRDNQPFVYIPAVGVFNALSVDKSVKIITKSIAKAYSFQKRDMNFNSEIKTIIIYPNYIDIPLFLYSNVTIVSPSLSTPTYKPSELSNQVSNIIMQLPFDFDKTLIDPIEHKRINYIIFTLPQANTEIPTASADVHIFENITYFDRLSSLIPQFVSFSKKLNPTIFAIKNLNCFNYENSNLENEDNLNISIKNMILFTQLLPIKNQFDKLIWQTIALFNFNQKTYALAGIFEKDPEISTSQQTLFKLFANSPVKEIPNDIEYGKMIFDTKNASLVSTEGTKSNLAGIISLLESRIDKTTQAEGQKSLKDVLIEKQANPTQQLPLKARQSWIDYFKDRFYSMIYGQR